MGNAFVQEFDSIGQFYKYICDTPLNSVFRWGNLSSNSGSRYFTQTDSFEDATQLMKNGWQEMAQKLTQKLTVLNKQIQPAKKSINVLSVAGYQPVVPLYLAGVPTDMVSKKLVTMKSKIINITKCVTYSAYVTTEQIVEESIKALQVVKKIEAQGYRVNLAIVLAVRGSDGTEILAKVRIKNANERLNNSKVAFPMVHPSMLRRLFFRYIETNPNVTGCFRPGYGMPLDYKVICTKLPDDIVLPAMWDQDRQKIDGLQGLV